MKPVPINKGEFQIFIDDPFVCIQAPSAPCTIFLLNLLSNPNNEDCPIRIDFDGEIIAANSFSKKVFTQHFKAIARTSCMFGILSLDRQKSKGRIINLQIKEPWRELATTIDNIKLTQKVIN